MRHSLRCPAYSRRSNTPAAAASPTILPAWATALWPCRWRTDVGAVGALGGGSTGLCLLTTSASHLCRLVRVYGSSRITICGGSFHARLIASIAGGIIAHCGLVLTTFCIGFRVSISRLGVAIDCADVRSCTATCLSRRIWQLWREIKRALVESRRAGVEGASRQLASKRGGRLCRVCVALFQHALECTGVKHVAQLIVVLPLHKFRLDLPAVEADLVGRVARMRLLWPRVVRLVHQKLFKGKHAALAPLPSTVIAAARG
mmetsp:Transcript_8904/g.27025  ORF Transcript_8904/g.27025 Transcript_8904/m.27025 type:complete len:260 (-) Transcript_8904:419-1198(-)